MSANCIGQCGLPPEGTTSYIWAAVVPLCTIHYHVSCIRTFLGHLQDGFLPSYSYSCVLATMLLVKSDYLDKTGLMYYRYRVRTYICEDTSYPSSVPTVWSHMCVCQEPKTYVYYCYRKKMNVYILES